MNIDLTAVDFFAGIGLVSYGLKRTGWTIKFAVDYSEEKQRIYSSNFDSTHYICADVAQITAADVPNVTLAHASFPCTDTSLAGARNGLASGESAAFWEFVRVLTEIKNDHSRHMPPLVMLENVSGLLTSGNGSDIIEVLSSLNELGYAVDILQIDAAHFVPQSRVRLFIIGNLLVSPIFDKKVLYEKLQHSSNARPKRIVDFVKNNLNIEWYIHKLPDLPSRNLSLKDIIDSSADWWEKSRTEYLYNQMFQRHKDIVDEMMRQDYWSYGTVFRRMRKREGRRRSTAELRIDGIAGCLRTPKGGSARQIVVRGGRNQFDARLLNAEECGRLMGVNDFKLPDGISLNEALFGYGDAVAVPVVEWISKYYLIDLVTMYQNQNI